MNSLEPQSPAEFIAHTILWIITVFWETAGKCAFKCATNLPIYWRKILMFYAMHSRPSSAPNLATQHTVYYAWIIFVEKNMRTIGKYENAWKVQML